MSEFTPPLFCAKMHKIKTGGIKFAPAVSFCFASNKTKQNGRGSFKPRRKVMRITNGNCQPQGR